MRVGLVNVISALSMFAIVFVSAGCADNSMHVDVNTLYESQGVTPVDGITSSGQPDQAALEVFSASAYEAVIDLRGEGEDRGIEEAAIVAELGMTYVSFPIKGRDAINFENAAKLEQLIAAFDGPVLVHCGSGNRVGALLALGKSLDGADDEAALEHGRQAGLTRLEKIVRERLQEPQ